MNYKGKIGVLLVNLGTPDSPTYGSVYKYLKQFLLDPRVIDYAWLPRNLLVRGLIIPFRSKSSAKLYKKLWTPEGSPLKVYGERLAEGVSKDLGDDYEVVLAMRYQSPSIEAGLNHLKNTGVSSIIILPLFPQYASASTGSVHEEVMRIMRKEQIIIDTQFVNSFYENPEMIDVFVKNAGQFDMSSYDHILFSFHGIPERQMRRGDPSKNHCTKDKDCCKTLCQANQHCYSAQCHQTAYRLAEKLGVSKEDYTISYQSRLGPEEWVKPYTSKVIEMLAGKGAKRLLVFCPAFVSDCLETTVEISYEYNEEFKEKGGEHIDLVPSLNDDPDWIKAVSNMVRERNLVASGVL